MAEWSCVQQTIINNTVDQSRERLHRIHRRQHVTDDAGISKHRLSPYYAYYHNDSL